MARKAGRPKAPSPSAALPPAYPGPKAGGMVEGVWAVCRSMLGGVYKAKEGSRRVCEIFRELPDRDEWADYYLAIPEPESLDHVAEQLGNQAYESPEDFYKQLHLVFLNAKHYNEENSQVWLDAQRLEEEILAAWRAHAEAGIFASPDPYHKPKKRKAERGSSRASGTPAPALAAPSPAGPKLEAIDEAEGKNSKKGIKDKDAETPRILRLPRVVSASKDDKVVEDKAKNKEAKTPAKLVLHAAAPATPAPQPPLTPSRPPTTQPPAPTPTRTLPPHVQAMINLDATLPRWPGPSIDLPPVPPQALGGVLGSGWWGDGAPQYEAGVGGPASWQGRIRRVVAALAGYRDAANVQLSLVFSLVPNASDLPLLSYNAPLSFQGIQQATHSGSYSNLRQLDLDMARLFEKSRRFLEARPVEYARVLTLQRLYNALTAPYPLTLPPTGVPAPSRNAFSSLPAGPGRARHVYDEPMGVTTGRVDLAERTITAEARLKGVSYKVGDWVHLVNPDDASKPIVGQIWKTFVPNKGYATHHVTVCWYFRPEQTIHPAEQRFFEREVFKSTRFCDHPVEDILELISCQFIAQYVRGRPKPPAYFRGWPTYVCASRYDDKDHIFSPVKDWLRLVPPEKRTSAYLDVVPYPAPIQIPLVVSPFTVGGRGTGGLGKPRRPRMPQDDVEEAEDPTAPVGRPRPRPGAAVPMPTGPAPPAYGQRPLPSPAVPPNQSLQRPPARQPWPQPTGPFANRTITAIMGGPQVVEQHARREVLPAETAALFEQDAYRNVLWFSGPPLAAGTVPVPRQPQHSLDYLAYLTKRKRGETPDGRDGKRFAVGTEPEAKEANGVDVDVGVDVDELWGALKQEWWAEGKDDDEVLEALEVAVNDM
ncbi:hypothetical protein Q5752_004818 [Cryptotrichosporon argae]